MKTNLIFNLLGFAIAGGLLAYRAYFRRDAVVKRELGKVLGEQARQRCPGHCGQARGRAKAAARA